MSAQTTYNHLAPIGSAGGIVDLSPYSIDTFLNEEETGTLKFGVGVFRGTAAGSKIKLPTSASASNEFEGIAVSNRTTEFDTEGKLSVKNNAAVGVMRYGKVYARPASGATPSYGDPVYIVNSGDEAGYVTNSSEGTVPINARFIGKIDGSANVVPIELFNQMNVAVTSDNAENVPPAIPPEGTQENN